jgi:DNA-binding HxlR family transcriptional regulator
MDSSSGIPGYASPLRGEPVSTFGRCPTHWLIRQLADRWSLPVLSALNASPKRFTEVLEILKPVSRRMLDRTLKKLIQIGLVSRTAYPASSPPRYALTELARTLAPPLNRLVLWSVRHQQAADARPVRARLSRS